MNFKLLLFVTLFFGLGTESLLARADDKDNKEWFASAIENGENRDYHAAISNVQVQSISMDYGQQLNPFHLFVGQEKTYMEIGFSFVKDGLGYGATCDLFYFRESNRHVLGPCLIVDANGYRRDDYLRAIEIEVNAL